ncbi:asparagine synthase [Clostridium sp. WILCCON 0269]|uniref:Asparagine synthase n=1 Tax=Candidatus Clostridium eludens TaxID=3381663 RepID=A0ABW8SQN5_9CLOT
MKNGLITAALGAAVTTGAVALRAADIRNRGMQSRNIIPMVETAALGFGLAHVVLGTIDLLQSRR